jgi:hypothetical protein
MDKHSSASATAGQEAASPKAIMENRIAFPVNFRSVREVDSVFIICPFIGGYGLVVDFFFAVFCVPGFYEIRERNVKLFKKNSLGDGKLADPSRKISVLFSADG